MSCMFAFEYFFNGCCGMKNALEKLPVSLIQTKAVVFIKFPILFLFPYLHSQVNVRGVMLRVTVERLFKLASGDAEDIAV